MRAVLLVVMALVASEASANKSQMSTARYGIGGIVGTTLGFGLGHKIQGRWWHGPGWGFALSQFYAAVAGLSSDSGYKHANKTPMGLNTFLGLKIVEAVSVWMPTPAPKPSPITTTRYALGALTGTVFGLGSGHLIQGRWLRGGWPYTVSQALLFYIMRNPCEITTSLNKNIEVRGCKKSAAITGLMLLLFSKVLETVSLWAPLPQEHTITTQASGVTWTPVVQGRKIGLMLAKAI